MRSVLIVEDHNDARREMMSILAKAFEKPEINAVPTLSQARLLIKETPFDLVVLDLGLPDGRGEDFIVEVLKALPNAYVVISTIHDESDRLLKALQNGAKGYLLKEQHPDHLIKEFQGILKGKPPLAPAVTRRILEFMRQSDQEETHLGLRVPGGLASEAQTQVHPTSPTADETEALENLTEREIEVLVLISKGFNRPEIAGILGISKHTVATHISKLYGKLGISTRSEAAVLAEKQNLL